MIFIVLIYLIFFIVDIQYNFFSGSLHFYIHVFKHILNVWFIEHECFYNAFAISSNAYSVSLPNADFYSSEFISLSLLITFYECMYF